MITEFNDQLKPDAHSQFQAWRRQNPDGFFLNRAAPAGYILHHVTCRHIGDDTWQPADYHSHSLAKSPKLCSLDNEELESWVAAQGAAVRDCNDCIVRGKSFSKEKYQNALRQIEPGLSKKMRAMLKAHAEAPGRAMTVIQLAAAANSDTENLTYSLYGRLGHRLAKVLDPKGDPERDAYGRPIWTRYIGIDYRTIRGSPVSWRMHVELAQALESIGWAILYGGNPFQDIKIAEEELNKEVPTVRQAIGLSRVGQGLFREQLLRYWTSCAVTSIPVFEALRASHIKPWAHSSNQERLDVFNGLLLVGTLDLVFDAGLISFDDSGQILISCELSKVDRKMLGLNKSMKLRQIEPRHLPYLSFHRDKVFSP